MKLVDLAGIQDELGTGIAEEHPPGAGDIVNEGTADALTLLAVPGNVDPAVVGLREAMMGLVEDEVSRLPNRPLTHDDAALALRRLATRLLHNPSTRGLNSAAEREAGPHR